MDPDANLLEQRAVRRRLRQLLVAQNAGGRQPGENPSLDEDITSLTERLCDLCEAMDDWLRYRGFLPTDWRSQANDFNRILPEQSGR